MRKLRAPDLTDERIQIVLAALDGWKGKLTWNLLIGAVKNSTGIAYSRFTFSGYPEIANAFAFKKDALRGTWSGTPAAPRDARAQPSKANSGIIRVDIDPALRGRRACERAVSGSEFRKMVENGRIARECENSYHSFI